MIRCKRCGKPISYMTGQQGRRWVVEPKPLLASEVLQGMRVISANGLVMRGPIHVIDDSGAEHYFFETHECLGGYANE
ncbi:MAG: hypothetical protein GTN64_05575 [Candidatus Latescibacteria bacterium]|nr:hypothetical protein [Candidatus Latescibacterota bacterium]NIO78079.1 hypothetical protein [Candidatus Latescibacterota bacterium]